MVSKEDQMLLNASAQAIDLAPKQPEVMQIPIKPIIEMTVAGIVSPRQAWHWIFKGIEPTEFDDQPRQKGVAPLYATRKR